MNTAAGTLQNIRVRSDGEVLYVTLNRPQARNALSAALIDELLEAFDYAEAGSSVRAIVLDGAGAHFCAGGDVREMRAACASGQPAEAVARVSAAIGRLCRRCAATPLALLAIVDGLGLACATDLTIATPRARFGLPETSLGLVPAQIAPLLHDRLGRSETRRLCVLGAQIDATEALRIGLVHEVSAAPYAAAQRAVGVSAAEHGADGADGVLG